MENTLCRFFKIFAFGGAVVGTACGAAVSLHFDPALSPVAADPHFNDGESVVVTAVSSDPTYTATVCGRDYFEDPTAPDNWGLLDRSKWWNGGVSGWLVRHGWESTVMGVPLNTQFDPAPASYLEIRIEHPQDVVFDSVVVTIDHPQSAEFINVWSSNSADNFQGFSVAEMLRSPEAETATIRFSDLGYSQSDPLVLRVYGVVGEDDGTFGLDVSAETFVLSSIPEPSSITAVACGAVGLFFPRSRRRR